mmetsp:Transcript_3890/g.3313  ORF Transcript_3890/g.3313 Transcript_3890/m.3313 type:complete len:80 (-) Transcript_3890:125-364(-)
MDPDNEVFSAYHKAHQLGAASKVCMKTCFGDDYTAEFEDQHKECFTKCGQHVGNYMYGVEMFSRRYRKNSRSYSTKIHD